MEVRAREGNTNWAVFALANSGDEQIDRLIVVPHYRMVGSGVFWPDLGLSRVASITSSGERPDRQDSATADIFRITLDPGTVMTYVLELRTDKLPQLYLWEPDAYKDKVNSFTLYHGIVIGIAGLLALFLTILFVVKGSVMFPAAAALGWAVLVYIGIDFGFWGKVFDCRRTPSGSGARRARRSWRRRCSCSCSPISISTAGTCATPTSRSPGSPSSPRWSRSPCSIRRSPPASRASRSLPSRCSASALVVYLSTHGFDRAVLLIPTWLLLVVWVIAAALAVTAVITNDIVGPALLGGLVLIVMLIGFTVMQHAFAGGVTSGIVSDVERRALALTGAGDMIWDWDVSADKVFTSPETEALLGLKRGALEGPAARWLDVLHPLDRDRFRAALDSVLEQRRGRLMPGFPPAHARRPLSLVRAQGAAGGRLRRRGGAAGRHAHRRHRVQERRGAAAARRGARQPHRPAQPRAVPRPPRGRARLRQGRSRDQADRDRDRSRPLQAGQRFRRHRGRRFDPADAGAPARPAAEAAGHAGAALRRPVRADPAVGARARAHHRLRRDAAQRSARADHLQRPRDLPHRLDRDRARRRRSRTAPRRCSRTPSSRCITPSASAATASRCSSRRCGRARPTG